MMSFKSRQYTLDIICIHFQLIMTLVRSAKRNSTKRIKWQDHVRDMYNDNIVHHTSTLQN